MSGILKWTDIGSMYISYMYLHYHKYNYQPNVGKYRLIFLMDAETHINTNI